MRNNDIHVLNWNKFLQSIKKSTKHSNVKNTSNTIVNKGILFEDLIEQLLVVMFPNEVWRRTTKSYDGKRDFVYPAEKNLPDQKWAECKNYNSNVSLNIIAPTLVMGTIENINTLFFFSYSSLNDNAVEGILRYSKRFKKSVKIFDGNMLESLICKYHNIPSIAKFFPNTDFIKAIKVLDERKVRIIKHITDLNGNSISTRHSFELGESFYVNIIIQNITLSNIDYSVELRISKKECLNCGTLIQNDSLPFIGIKSFSILCQALNPGSLTINIKIIDAKTKKTFEKRQRIKIIEEQYLFWAGTKALNVLSNCQDHLNNYITKPLLVVAETGMGKSTLLNILANDENVYQKYKIININLDLSRNCYIRNLLSQLVDVHEDYIVPDEQLDEDNFTVALMITNYAESAESIARIIMKFYDNSRPYLFIVDDIQKINRAYISLFHELEAISKENHQPIYYLCALDNSVCSLDQLFIRLNRDNNIHTNNCNIIRLRKFDKNDIIVYLKLKFGLEKIENYFYKFEKKIRPLDVHIFCTCLKRNKIISYLPELKIYQINNPFKFSDSIKMLYSSDIQLFNLFDSLESVDIPEYILKYLYITDRLKIDNQYQDIISQLISNSILKEKDSYIVFFHDEIRKFVGDKLEFTEEDYADIYAEKDVDNPSKALCVLNQLGKIRKGHIFLHDFFYSNFEITKKSKRLELCRLIFENLELLAHYNLIHSALHFVKINYSLLNWEIGHSSFWKFLKYIADSALVDVWDTDEDSVENMAFFVKKFFDRSLSTYNYNNILQYYNKFEKIFYNIKNICPSRRFYWLAHYTNRVAIALDRDTIPLTKETTTISDMYQKSEMYCKLADDNKYLQLQITIDNFYKHYIYRHNMDTNIICNTYIQLQNIKGEINEEPILLKYHLLLLEYLQVKLSNHEKKDFIKLKDKVKCVREQCSSSFFTIKLYLMEIYIHIEIGNYSTAHSVLVCAYDFVYKKGMREYLYKLTYIETYILSFQNDITMRSKIYQSLILSIEQLLDTRKNSLNDLKREIFLVVQLMHSLNSYKPDWNKIFSSFQNDDIYIVIPELLKYINGKPVAEDKLFSMQSYYIFNGINFPNI